MSHIDFLQVLLWFLFIVTSGSLLGLNIVSVIKKFTKEKGTKKQIPSEEVGAGLLIGIGVIGYLSLFVGVLGLFTKPVLVGLIAISALISIKQAVPLFSSVLSTFKDLIKEYKNNLLPPAAILISLITLGSLYLTAMQPPYASDELHYHLPEVQQIVDNHKIDLSFGGHPFYGNIPKLMEVILAVGKTISSYQLSHALNFAVFLGFLLVVFGFIKKHYGIRAASFAVLLLTFFDDMTWNATTGFIDTATTAFEISALLFILNWSAQKDKLSFYLSAILIGLAVSLKYSPLPTAVFILAIIAVNRVNDLFIYILPAVIVGGFWYIKNIILFKNPFYPLYFGHAGYPEDQYKSLIDAIQEFGPKTPAYFFHLTTRYLTTNGIFIFLSIYIAPIFLFIKKQNKFRISLFLYFLLYTIYWFLIATHQIRFLMTGLVISIIILSVIASKVKEIYFAVTVLLILVVSLFYSKNIAHIDYKSVWSGFWNTKFHLVERQYALGNVSQDQFLTRQFGCQYSAIKYLENNNLKGTVIDNWSVWFAPSVSFYADKNNFQSVTLDLSKPSSQLFQYLKEGDIKYVYFDSKVKASFLKSEDPLVIQSRDAKLPTEIYLLKYSKLVYQNSTCSLFEIIY